MPEHSAAVLALRAGRPSPLMDLECYARGPAVLALDSTGELGEVMLALGRSILQIEALVGQGRRGHKHSLAGATNVQGETQIALDLMTNEIVVNELFGVPAIAGILSEELADPQLPRKRRRLGGYLVAVDPLDGSSNAEVNIPVGTIFSVLRCARGTAEVGLADFLQPGTQQICAGFALYGAATVLVLATPGAIVEFTLDRSTGSFLRSDPALRVPEPAGEFAINVSNERFWPEPVRRYIADCLAGRPGPRGKDYNMRWVASLVAEAYRILTRGGVFLYPADSRPGTRAGRLRLLYECNPIAFVMEQAGGAASTGRGRMLDVQPTALHQRIPLVFGSRAEVAVIERYHDDVMSESGIEFPLFNRRTMFRGR